MARQATKISQIKERTNPILGLAHLFLSITSGWSLKNVTRSAYYSIGAFTLFLVYSIIGVLRFTHPNPTVLRKFSNSQTSTFVQLLLPLLITVDVLKLTEKENAVWLGATAFVAMVTLTSFWFHWKRLNHVLVLWILVLLAYAVWCGSTTYSLDECYWTVGLLILIALNNFVFQLLPSHYEISRLEISTIGMCFFVIFALNSVNEIASWKDSLKSQTSRNTIR